MPTLSTPITATNRLTKRLPRESHIYLQFAFNVERTLYDFIRRKLFSYIQLAAWLSCVVVPYVEWVAQ